MSAEDTKASRTDSPDHEYVALQPITNYDGYVYWGEYPLSFAACLSQVKKAAIENFNCLFIFIIKSIEYIHIFAIDQTDK